VPLLGPSGRSQQHYLSCDVLKFELSVNKHQKAEANAPVGYLLEEVVMKCI
jgi:hypothetical protein